MTCAQCGGKTEILDGWIWCDRCASWGEPPRRGEFGPAGDGPLERMARDAAATAYATELEDWRRRTGAVLRACAEVAGLPVDRLGPLDDELALIVEGFRGRR